MVDRGTACLESILGEASVFTANGLSTLHGVEGVISPAFAL